MVIYYKINAMEGIGKMTNKIIKTLTVVFSFLLIIAIIFGIYAIFQENSGTTETTSGQIQNDIYHFCLMVTCVFAIFYILSGCTKASGAKFFQVFMILYGVSIFFILIFTGEKAVDNIPQLLRIIAFGALCLLAFAKDLGQVKSTVFASLVLACNIVEMFFVPDSMLVLTYSTRICQLVLSATTLLMVCAKYEDKKSRGSK